MLAFVLAGQAPAGAAPIDYADGYLMGKPDSPVRLEVFSDLQCPSCRTFYLYTVTDLIKEYSAGNKVAVIFRDFPLQMHPVSRPATRYAVAAKLLGREQWTRVIEYLYTHQAEWSYDGKIEPVLSRILTPGEMQTIKTKMNDPAIEQSIDREVALGNEKKVSQTPTIFVTMGGKEQRLEGGLTFLVLKQFIDRSLKQ
jgi:protein-disulfide isomerase